MSANGGIQHRRTIKEAKIGRYFVDGLDEHSNTIYQYNGCVFHGHPECKEEDDQVPFRNITMKGAFEEWEERKEYLERHEYQVEVKSSCEWLEERKDIDNHHFLQNMNFARSFVSMKAIIWSTFIT